MKKKQSTKHNWLWALSILNHEQENKRLYIFVISNGFIYSSICVLLLYCGCHNRVYFRLCMLYACHTQSTVIISHFESFFFFFFAFSSLYFSFIILLDFICSTKCFFHLMSSFFSLRSTFTIINANITTQCA